MKRTNFTTSLRLIKLVKPLLGMMILAIIMGVARAFLHDAPFLLLDEPTSNLDSLSEGIILKALREECAGKTVLLVSHRKSTMAITDTVYSVECGRVS